MLRRYAALSFLFMVLLAGCNFSNRVVKDIPVQEMDDLKTVYANRTAWTRTLLIDLGPEGLIDRDTKLKIINLDLHWTGSVTVEGPGRKRLTHGLGLERPLTKLAVEEKLNKTFWFADPETRYRTNLRKYGKKTAKSIFEHQLFKGMKREAALDSWGYPDEMKSFDMGGTLQEQWIYKDIRQKAKKRYIYIMNGLVDKWEE